eukprot:3707554-Pyramimonas_sp.AAC.1
MLDRSCWQHCATLLQNDCLELIGAWTRSRHDMARQRARCIRRAARVDEVAIWSLRGPRGACAAADVRAGG